MNKLQLGIIGLPLSGKTTVFNALSGSHAAVGDYSTAKLANLAVVKVPDPRMDRLVEIFQPKKITPTEIEYVDIAGLTRDASASDRKKEAAYVHSLRMTDALLQVVRCFENTNVAHPDGSVDPKRDINEVDSELILSDLIVVENRLSKLEHLVKVTKKDQDETHLRLLQKCKETLEQGLPLRSLEFTPEEKKALGGYRFLSQKPMLYLLNLDEKQCLEGTRWEEDYSFVTQTPQSALAHICALLQMEIAGLDEADRAEFMMDLGLKELASQTVIKKSFELLGLIVFLTGGAPEVHSWPIYRGTTAQAAAGEIHTDIQKGFIKAEVVPYADLDRLGSWSRARDEGKLHLHGKDYIVQDGDVVLFRFNV
jgi:ribosome-binding ATPase